MSLRHIAIPSWRKGNVPIFPSYALATRVQSKLQQDLLAWKASLSVSPHEDAHAHAHAHEHQREHARSDPPPPPTLISFTPAPTYTLGRRQTEPLSANELARLQAPLRVEVSEPPRNKKSGKKAFVFTPEVLHAPRGGLTTYHGPGQVVLWPVIDLRSPLHGHFSVRDYVCLLEKTTIATLRELYNIDVFTTSNPGVWVREKAEADQGREEEEEEEEEEKKIAALGVHLRRHVTGLGVAINFGMPVDGSEFVNPWARIVACGLGEKGVTTVAKHLNDPVRVRNAGEEIASMWAAQFASRLKVGNNAEPENSALVQQDNWNRWERELQIDRASEGFVTADVL